MDNIRKVKGCVNPTKKNVYAYENVKFKKCPANFLNNSVSDYMTMFLNYEKGIMPYSGCLMEQPYKVFEIFGIIEKYRRVKSKDK